MNLDWLTSYWRPKIKDTTVASTSTPETLWDKCTKCGEIEYHKNWHANLYVCPHCTYHKPLDTRTRFDFTLDAHYQTITLPKVKDDPIHFTDSKPYTQRLTQLRKQGLTEAIGIAKGTIDNQDAIVAAMDFNFIGGSMGVFVGQTIITACNLASTNKTPLICFAASGGARMQEGIYALMQMPRTTLAVENLKSQGIPFIIVLTHPSMGGVLASFAMLGDITIAEPGATIGFSGRRVIENTIHQKLPDDFQTSQFQYDCGFVDQIISRGQMKHALGNLLKTIHARKH